MNRPVIIALDFSSTEAVEEFLTKMPNEPLFLKVGMELFYSSGAQLIHSLKEKGHRIFLDLKLHDIPNTVQQGMKALAQLNVDIVNVHAAGGSEMMRRAMDGLYAGTPSGIERPKLIAVTQLTSTSEQVMQQELKINGTMKETVQAYAKLASESGLDGVVSSPLEVPLIHEACGEQFLTVTPGIRLAGDAVGDQKRVTTPSDARKLGSWGIVVGRSITASKDPASAYERVVKEWEELS
ncbi:orotidine-5'-phosphate decarboxylase [Alkalihalobacterium chitinilyticum]|uniref:Orotidine 5'-phosphate decarboxylase n=1 Tax=Alkalihalobacterium chitinilyticum TaxID=2980103 RepID=A0ABT5VC70_9BACI|nr:orotidine-5'-phosphate decarboxylase [Alkalihalobacterium chitinilyticum]MDE5413030.1 orotidine-5'-phosphate decarboxylase [Alkalihalobacterium chitinilyticum]